MTPTELIAAREALELSREELGVMFDVSPRAIQAWEHGFRRVPPGVAVAMRLLLQQHRSQQPPRKRAAR